MVKTPRPRKGAGNHHTSPMSIPTIFHRKGFTHRLMKREGNIALYSLTRFGRMSYEVVKIRAYKTDRPFINRKAGDEYLPSPEEWGTCGFTYNSLSDAERHFKALTNLNPITQ